jgi:putative ABC transport system permease protein
MWYVIGIDRADGADATEVSQAYADQLAPATIADIDLWRQQTLGPIAERLTVAAAVAAIVAVALTVLMTALFTRMLIARDEGQIAVQRAIGADDAGLRRQYLTRILLVLVLGVNRRHRRRQHHR